MTNDNWFNPKGSRPEDGWTDVVDGRVDGWTHTGIRTGALTDGGELRLPAAAVERMVVPLSGSFHVTWSGAENGEQGLEGRGGVFEGPTDVLYLGSGLQAQITGSGRVAVAEAPPTSSSRSRTSRRPTSPSSSAGPDSRRGRCTTSAPRPGSTR